MAKGPSYNVPFRRRKEGRTDYRLRRGLILSGFPRLVVRKTRKHIIVQLIEPTISGDKVITSAHSSQLMRKYGWLGSLSSLSASYLTGLLGGYRSAAKGVKKAVLDIGLQTPSRGSRVFAALKGFLDTGLDVPCEKEILPDENRIVGRHIAEYAEEISSDVDTYSRLFSLYLSRGLPPQKISDHFFSVKEKIKSDFKESARE